MRLWREIGMVAIEFFTLSEKKKIFSAPRSVAKETSQFLLFCVMHWFFSQYCRSSCFGDLCGLEM